MNKRRNQRYRTSGAEGGKIERRDFLRLVGAAALGSLTLQRPVMAGPFTENDYTRLIPADKKLAPKWVASLFRRGRPKVCRGKELEWIGMPVGGICAGQLYLGGDGKLWLWDIFNDVTLGVCGRGSRGANYVKPLKQTSPLDQGFAVRITEGKDAGKVRALDRTGFRDIAFRGEYPIGEVTYRDPASPLEVKLSAFSPFIPLNVEDSSLPATVMQYHLVNRSEAPLRVEIAGRLENAVCLKTGRAARIVRRNRVTKSENALIVESSAEKAPADDRNRYREDILFEDFEKATYDGWTVTGTAFGEGPIRKDEMPSYQGDVGGHGRRVVNSHNTRHGEDVRAGDAHTGTLTSRPFVIERDFIRFFIGGGAHKGKTCINLIVDGKVVRSATGRNDNRMKPHAFDVREFKGKTARLRIVDAYTGGWGNIGIDYIVFTDRPLEFEGKLEEQPDFGTMALALLSPEKRDRASPAAGDDPFEELFGKSRNRGETETASSDSRPLKGAVGRSLTIPPGEGRTVTFAVAWRFPNLRLPGFKKPVGRYYARRFASASDVVRYLAANFSSLAFLTRLWRKTWYDSTLPLWFLDRTFANTSTLATSTCHRFADGRFYGWEGVGCCAGTCTHVWHYAQAVARIFPQLEKDLRERVDFSLAFDPSTGAIRYRGEFTKGPATDGQAGCILRAYREHLMSADDAFLKRNWRKIKKAVSYLIAKDGNDDGIIEGAQPNTLDAAWYGKIAWISSLYLAALRAGEEMAKESGDHEFAEKVRRIFESGSEKIVRELFNGEYFIQIPDPAHMSAIGTDNGCHIDQVLGQSWAFQVALGRIFGARYSRSALRSLWKYNFAPDVGPFRAVYKRGRPYALAGDAGLIMCTWPKGGKRKDWEKHWQFMYFNECMTGFEYQVAGHMIREGLIKEGLAVTRAIHDRYHPSLRNPYNEIECSDHYARAMASFGVFLAACGYEHHGPKKHLGFAPRLTPDDFRAAFTAAEGWGTFTQKREGAVQRETIEVRWGRLRLETLAFEIPEGRSVSRVTFERDHGKEAEAAFKLKGRRLEITLPSETVLEAGQRLTVTIV